ncbi:hypothetical protein F5I97DRAFT_1497258 [Phlebopus sp. FC_14]|nr:hypothetical protein F5I97DRAFT_1497258 [Phlebopus sp. FC_14]
MPIIHAAVTFFVAIWSLILRLVRSFACLFTRKHYPTDLCTLPVVRERNAASVLSQPPINFRPIVLSQRELVYTSFRAHDCPKKKIATNTTLSPPSDVVDAELSTLYDADIPRISTMDSNVAELGCSVTIKPLVTTIELFSPSRGSLPITKQTRAPWTLASPSPVHQVPMSSPLFEVPLTPPDRCYLAPVPPLQELYYESWPTPADRFVPRKPPSSPLKTSFGSEAVFPEPIICSWDPSCPTSPVKIWTSIPNKDTGSPALCGDDVPLSPAGCRATDVVVGATHNSCITSFFDHASSVSSESGLFDFSVCARIHDPEDVNHNESSSRGPDKNLSRHALPRTTTPTISELLIWRRYGSRLPGKNRSRSTEWYNASAYVASPVGLLSPPDSPLSAYSSRTDVSTTVSCYGNNSLFGDHGLQNEDGRMLSDVDNRPRDGSSSKRDVISNLNDKQGERDGSFAGAR